MADSNFENVIIDGSVLEGGGQILRNAVSIAVLAKRAVTIEKIRAGRPKPGLSAQHLTGLELAALVSDAQLQGCVANSQQITFTPKCIKTGEFEGDAKTAGSVALLAQITVPILAFGLRASTLLLKGGTDASFAPPIDYLSEVTAYYYRKMGLHFDIEVLERGYYPQGGGRVKVFVQPVASKLKPITLQELGSLSRIFGSAFVAGRVSIKVAEQMYAVAKRLFRSYFPDCPVNISAFRAPDNRFRGNVATFLFVLETSTGCRLAASGLSNPRGPPPENLVTDAIEELMTSVRAGSCCDKNMQDMLVLPMALADGKSSIRTTTLTLHTQSAIYVAEKLLPVKFVVEEQTDGTVILSCEGIGLSASS